MSKIDPRSIHIDQRKRDARRDAWDRDYMGYYYLREVRDHNCHYEELHILAQAYLKKIL